MGYSVEDVSFTYPSGDHPVLDRVSLTVKPGEIVALLGPNGAGKTTLLHCMMNLLKPSSGSVAMEGTDIRDLSARELAGKVAYVPQTHEPTFDYTVLDFVLMGRAPRYNAFGHPDKGDQKRCMEILEELGIEKLADHSYLQISGGERQQVMIARALAQEPEIMIFDEPTAHLDFGNQQRALTMIHKMAQKGHGVLMTSHHPDHALMIGDVTALLYRNGRLESGKTQEIITENRLAEVYQTPLRLIEIKELGRKACLLPGIGTKE